MPQLDATSRPSPSLTPLRVSCRVALLLGVLLALSGGCRSGSEQPDPGAEPVSDTTVAPNTLPALDLREDTPGLLLTWVDEQGDFHVAQAIGEVPETARAQVRVVVESSRAGTGPLVYVADLRTARGDGSYPVSTRTRAQWEELGASKRKARLEALAPSARPASSSGAPGLPSAAGARVTATIYGADWCKPCHQAQDLLERLGVEVTKKDIEKTPAARAEMATKLAKVGRNGASIPVIDVMGRIQVGFSEVALRHAVEQARGARAL